MKITKSYYYLLAALSLIIAACGGGENNENTSIGQNNPDNSSTVVENKVLRCGDILSNAQAAAIGIEKWDETASQDKPNRGINCTTGAIVITLFRSSDFRSMTSGMESAGFETVEGPSLGAESSWYKGRGANGVFIRSENDFYAANLSHVNRAVLEPIAIAFAVKLDEQ